MKKQSYLVPVLLDVCVLLYLFVLVYKDMIFGESLLLRESVMWVFCYLVGRLFFYIFFPLLM